jgi:ABC-type nitrate/sulfonate/bicarbonate transport system substrate-binding protein
MQRRKFVVGSTAASVCLLNHGLSGDLVRPALAQAPTTVRLALSWISNVEYAGFWIALERGFFAEEKLQVQHLPGGPNAPPPLVTLAADKADLGYAAWLPFLDAVGRGNDFVLIAATFPVSPLGIISRADKPILKPADIVGKKILAQGPNERTTIDATLALNKLAKEWEFVPAGFSPEPLLSKQGDGYTAFGTNQVVALERMGLVRDKDFHFVSFDSLGYKSYASVLFTTRKYLTDNRPTVVGFCRALTRGWLENAKDPSVAAKLAVSKYGADLGLDLRQQTRQNELQLAMTKNPAKPDQPLLALDRDTMVGPMFDAARASGRANLPDPDKLADFRVMQEVHATLKKS